ncbi:hypothetical protein ACRAWF_16280 [Streptomyces sp. L7]
MIDLQKGIVSARAGAFTDRQAARHHRRPGSPPGRRFRRHGLPVVLVSTHRPCPGPYFWELARRGLANKPGAVGRLEPSCTRRARRPADRPPARQAAAQRASTTPVSTPLHPLRDPGVTGGRSCSPASSTRSRASKIDRNCARLSRACWPATWRPACRRRPAHRSGPRGPSAQRRARSLL